jgi:molybdopterin converting factor small subunit
MDVTVTLYGRYKKLADSSEVVLFIPDDGSIWHVIEAFIQKYPSVAKDKSRIMVTKNQQFAPPDTSVSPEDKISIAPPLVAGG